MTARPKKALAAVVEKTGPGSDEPFTYATDAGAEFTLPSLAKLFKSAGELRRMRRMSPMDMTFYVIERDCTPEELDAFDAMEMDEFERFSAEWAEHSGVDLGESSAS